MSMSELDTAIAREIAALHQDEEKRSIACLVRVLPNIQYAPRSFGVARIATLAYQTGINGAWEWLKTRKYIAIWKRSHGNGTPS